VTRPSIRSSPGAPASRSCPFHDGECPVAAGRDHLGKPAICQLTSASQRRDGHGPRTRWEWPLHGQRCKAAAPVTVSKLALEVTAPPSTAAHELDLLQRSADLGSRSPAEASFPRRSTRARRRRRKRPSRGGSTSAACVRDEHGLALGEDHDPGDELETRMAARSRRGRTARETCSASCTDHASRCAPRVGAKHVSLHKDVLVTELRDGLGELRIARVPPHLVCGKRRRPSRASTPLQLRHATVATLPASEFSVALPVRPAVRSSGRSLSSPLTES